ncbi:MAG: 50S ribosomal protein L9 [Candidatus Terrybacteria bacterium RIFCSPHIGHO2_01_FULL_48_17]|uniref:Large ribosomal subunit protein bL9 n=1 Tax=Candidatus Terrybacteria bacterium RIFCSPHIGHO2_01_FULL_48_17 TaxID=1802362 RepID=A0A1G2PK68_9BACT|nr:MAG: 50S ribosomal protein L9 [Candidatus Terrybacteria bacterium RIFCSPHIGHO2_01_FULL_48_17]OHA53874.1 MAG: 50S ribosomal protein L9 [Candidatus Terrybacteria bacterium RIFCSPLOWO2_01_FULL_48_14]
MLVILLQDVKNIGKKNMIVEVADGFGRNFLIPRGMAKPATSHVLDELAHKKTQETKEAERELKQTQELASKIDGLEIVIPARVAEPGGNLFAAITTRNVSEVLKQQGYPIETKQLQFDSIKSAGEYPLNVLFPHGLEVQIKLIIEEIVDHPQEP